MGEFRIPSEKSKYYIPKEEYLTAVHFCRQYPEWAKELSAEPDSGGAIRYDKERVQTSGSHDANEELAMRRYELARKKQLVDDAAHQLHTERAFKDSYGVAVKQEKEFALLSAEVRAALEAKKPSGHVTELPDCMPEAVPLSEGAMDELREKLGA